MITCDLCGVKVDERGPIDIHSLGHWDGVTHNSTDVAVCDGCYSSYTPQEMEGELNSAAERKSGLVYH